jgi:ribosomal-protein-alanine N-acetyltransferase
MAGIEVRPATADDLSEIAGIQARSPEASQWDPQDYLAHDCIAAVLNGSVAGFLVARRVAGEESEILNLAVDPRWRRRGIGRALVLRAVSLHAGALFLEVRESNQAALKFYKSLGFQVVAERAGYYAAPPESAIVMKFHSC